jgi:hypothetical protein
MRIQDNKLCVLRLDSRLWSSSSREGSLSRLVDQRESYHDRCRAGYGQRNDLVPALCLLPLTT